MTCELLVKQTTITHGRPLENAEIVTDYGKEKNYF
jgi:hypothetical protein